MNIIEETYMHILNGSSFSDEKFAMQIINESVYAYEELKSLIDSIYEKIISARHCTINSDEIINLLKLNKKKLRKLNKNVKLYVSFLKYVSELNIFNEEQIEDINRRIKNDEGLLVSEFNAKNEFAIIIKRFFNADSIFDVLYHELIHFLQKIYGCSIHKILKSNLIISDNDKKSIEDDLKINEDLIENSFEYFYNESEFEAFIANMQKELIDFFNLKKDST